jgi:hypothetical protein
MTYNCRARKLRGLDPRGSVPTQRAPLGLVIISIVLFTKTVRIQVVRPNQPINTCHRYLGVYSHGLHPSKIAHPSTAAPAARKMSSAAFHPVNAIISLSKIH